MKLKNPTTEAHQTLSRDLPLSPALERHFSISELATLWQLSEKKISELFKNQPGVVSIGSDIPRVGKRGYVTLRIPQSVAERVHRQLSAGLPQAFEQAHFTAKRQLDHFAHKQKGG